MCNLYSITTNQAAIIALFRVINRYVGNLPPMLGVFPDYPAPVVHNAGSDRELTMMRWGMPPPPRTDGYPVTNMLLVSDEPEHLSRGRTLVDLATGVRLPTCYPFRDLVAAGGLMAYYRDLLDAFRQLAAQMAQILSGQTPADMPFRQPTNFRLSINTKAAQKIGVVLPQTLLVSADEVIE